MNREECQRVLELQKKAYELLLWISEQAAHQPTLLSEESIEQLRYAESCAAWVRHMKGIFPVRLRPEENELIAFAHLLSSFFNTSFHVKTVNESDWYDSRGHDYETRTVTKLVPGAPKWTKGPAAKKRAQEKDRQSAHNLQLIALEELAIENDVDLTRAQIEAIAVTPDVAESLNLRSYAHELVRRSQFASQGAAVHQMWLSLDKTTRAQLNVDAIWNARSTLIEHLQQSR